MLSTTFNTHSDVRFMLQTLNLARRPQLLVLRYRLHGHPILAGFANSTICKRTRACVLLNE